MSERKLEDIDPDLAIFAKTRETLAIKQRWCIGPVDGDGPEPTGCLLVHLSWGAGVPLLDWDCGPAYDHPTLARLTEKLGYGSSNIVNQYHNVVDSVCGAFRFNDSHNHEEVLADFDRRVERHRQRVREMGAVDARLG